VCSLTIHEAGLIQPIYILELIFSREGLVIDSKTKLEIDGLNQGIDLLRLLLSLQQDSSKLIHVFFSRFGLFCIADP